MPVDFMLNTSPDIAEAIRRDALVILPVGQVEEHGPHLPVGTDTYIAEGIAKRLAAALDGEIPVVLLPTVWSAYSVDALGEWPGLIKVRTRVLIDLVYDIVASVLRMGFRKVLILNGHGNNPELLKTALRELADDFEETPILANVWSFGAGTFNSVRRSEPGGAIHAGEYETSLILAMGYPVDMSKAPSGDSFRFKSKFRSRDSFSGSDRVTWSTWKLQKSRTGVYGDPTVASIETGTKVLEAAVDELAEMAREYYHWQRG
jgi:creatinine amidohydrolase